MNPTLRRLGVTAAAAAFAATVAAPAWAADPPAPDTPECVELVELDPLVISARAALDAAPQGLPVVDLADLEASVTAAVGEVTARLCTGTAEPTTTTTPAAPTSTSSTPTTTELPPAPDDGDVDLEGDGTVDLAPTDDDDSTAVTSGEQIIVVPEGSASTGS